MLSMILSHRTPVVSGVCSICSARYRLPVPTRSLALTRIPKRAKNVIASASPYVIASGRLWHDHPAQHRYLVYLDSPHSKTSEAISRRQPPSPPYLSLRAPAHMSLRAAGEAISYPQLPPTSVCHEPLSRIGTVEIASSLLRYPSDAGCATHRPAAAKLSHQTRSSQ